MPHCTDPSTAKEAAKEAATEAARFALLRRLAPAIRHQLVGEFQPINMAASLLDRLLQNAAPDMDQLRENSAALGALARTAASTSMHLVTWLLPKRAALTPFSSGLSDGLSLLTSELRFKGFVIVNDIAEQSVAVNQLALRSVFAAALLALCDQQPGPANIVLTAQPHVGGVELSMRRHAVERSADNWPSADYRSLTWCDVEALAQAESVGFAQSGESVQLLFSKASLGTVSIG